MLTGQTHSAMSRTVDLSGFPVVRIDQIPLIDSDTLVQAQKDVKSLIASMLAESDTVPPMVHYLRKQNEATAAELMNRLAQDRINSLLSGATALLNNDRSKYLVDDDDEPPLVTKPSADKVAASPAKAPESTAPTSTFQPLPLPSEVRSKRVSALASTLPVLAAPTGDSAVASDNAASTNEQVSPLSRSQSSPAGIAMSSSRSVSERGTKRIDFGQDENAGSDSSPPRRRPMSGDIRPSKRSQEFINNNFGNLFIVAGDGRRKRPQAKKAPAESMEVIKARERLERRKAAMQRLLDRKEERQKMLLAKREAKRAAMCEAELATSSPADSPSASRNRKASRSSKPPAHGNTRDQELDRDQASSGSESVSGGDEEMEVVVDERLVSAVALAQQQAAQEADTTSAAGDVSAAPRGDAPSPHSPVPTRNRIKQGNAAVPAVTKPLERKPPVVAGSERVKRTRSTEKERAPATYTTSAATHTQTTSMDKVTSKGSSTAKRKSAYRTETALKVEEEEDPQVQKIDISRPASSSQDVTLQPAESSATIDTVDTADQSENVEYEGAEEAELGRGESAGGGEGTQQSEVTGEDLVADFESKNFAALQSLRSMKLKKEQQKLQAIKASNAKSAPDEDSPPAFQEPAHLEPIDHSEGDNVENTLTQSLDSDFPPFPSFAVGAEEKVPDQESKSLVLPISVVERPPSRVVRATVSVVEIKDSASSTVDSARAVSAPAQTSTRPSSSTLQHTTIVNTSAVTTAPAQEAASRPPSLSPRHTVDLSHTTLSMLPDLMSPKRANSTHPTAAGPRHPIVSAMLAGAKHSHLLYSADGVYCCEKGPEDLPGLCAWKLVSIVDECANWVVNIAKYTEAVDKQRLSESDPKTEEFTSRAAVRKSVSLGLLVLLLDCEDLLLGTVRLFNAEHFTTLWKEYIRLFDEKAESAAVQWGNEALFTHVAVCGNCHAVCKKLENILKTIFVPQDAVEARLHRKLHAQEGTLPVQVGRLTRPLNLENLSGKSDVSEEVATEALGTARDSVFPNMHSTVHTARSATSLDYSHDPSSSHLDTHQDQDMHHSSTSLLDAASTDSADPNFLQESNMSVDPNDLEGSDIDDEASILPVCHINLGSEEQNIEESAHNITERFLRKPSSGLQHVSNTVSEPAQSLMSTVKTRAMASSSSVASLQSTISKKTLPSNGVQLSDFYPSIGCIFPAVYGQSQASNRQGDDGAAAARGLIESMQVQCKIYEEWIEVMSDYSTVFSDDRRGVAENYYGSGARGGEGGAGEEDGDGAGNSTVYKGGTRSLHFRVKSARSEVNNIVSDVFNNFLHAWEELPAGLGLGLSWNVLWTWSKPRIKLSHLLIWQRVNHYPDSKELTRKDLLKKNIQRYTVHGGKGGEQFNIMPLTYLLPHEYTAFVQAFTAAESVKSAEQNQNFWILKPLGMSRGRGISLVKDLSQIAYSVASVVQKYIERPLCLKGYKFDLRLYILVTSFKPLEAFIYRDGFARVSTHQYSLNPEDTENKFIHLTNSSIQVQNTEGPTKDSPLQAGEDEEDTGGTKISLLGNNGLWKRLEEFGIDIPALWSSISSLVIKSLVMVDDKMVHQPCCFEMFGYDVLIDSDLRPWLLEVNASPSLARPSPLDVRVKNAMIRDIIGVLDPAPYDRAAVLRILQKRLANISKNRFTMGKNDPDLESDLREILGDYVPRLYGEVPTNMGNYEMLAPNTKEYERVLKLKKKIIKS